MSLFRDPAEHEANPPETWVVVKVAEKLWRLETKDGAILSHYPTRKEATLRKSEGFYFTLYRKESLWFAGEHVHGWHAYEAGR